VRILGIDPGSHVTGYGVIDHVGGRLRLVDAGVVRAPKGGDLTARLRTIHEGVTAIIAEHAPDRMAVEDVFVAKNARSSLVLGHARGVILLAAALRDIPIAEYAPREVKLALTGNGATTKEQVRYMVVRLLALNAEPSSLDVSDALAVALCHAMRSGGPAGLARAGGQR
jgi:crossover junction endodeoxyribonuclease RuvC